MKQRIEFNQLKELDKKAAKRLREWWRPTCGDLYGCNFNTNLEMEKIINHYGEFDKEHDVLPLLTIGQMIEYLGKKKLLKNEDVSAHLMFEIDYRDYENLCNKLWEEVKEDLNG